MDDDGDIDDDIDDDGDDIDDDDDDDDDGDNDDDDDDDIIYLTIQDGAIKSWSRCQTSISTVPHYQVPPNCRCFSVFTVTSTPLM